MADVNKHGEEMCETWDIPKSGCAHCVGVEVEELPRAKGLEPVLSDNRPMRAVFNGFCYGDCGGAIEKGEMIKKWGDRPGAWAHEECI